MRRKRTKNNKSKKNRKGSDTVGPVLTDGTEYENNSPDEDAEAEVLHLRKIYPLRDLFRRFMDYKKHRLETRPDAMTRG